MALHRSARGPIIGAHAGSHATIGRERPDEPYGAEIDLEHERWTEIVAAVPLADARSERIRPGYYRDPDWTVKDMVAHLGTWMAEAEIQLLRIEAGTYDRGAARHRRAERAVPRRHA